MRTAFLTLAAAYAIVLVAGCQQSNASPARAHEKPTFTPPRSVDEVGPGEKTNRVVDKNRTIEQPEHWLVIKKAVNVDTPPWAKGDFDAERNKIGIVTRNVAEFTIDTDRIPIDWNRVVIISLDGVNAELRPRDYSPLLFRRKGFSSWSVVEP